VASYRGKEIQIHPVIGAAGEASSIPKWRLSVRTFGQSSGYPVLGVYRRIGKRHDVGIAVGGNMDLASIHDSMSRMVSSPAPWYRQSEVKDGA
jgi:hypothetical protein